MYLVVPQFTTSPIIVPS